MFAAKFSDVHIEAVGLHMPDQQVTSAEIEDKIAPVYEKLKVPFGTLEKLSGVASRGMFTREETPSDVATLAAKKALSKVGFETSAIQTVINCSVTRDYFEPATGVLVHENLGLGENVMAMDITNACAGFSNGMFMVANLIQSGVIKAGLIVAGENLVHIIDAHLESFSKVKIKIS